MTTVMVVGTPKYWNSPGGINPFILEQPEWRNPILLEQSRSGETHYTGTAHVIGNLFYWNSPSGRTLFTGTAQLGGKPNLLE